MLLVLFAVSLGLLGLFLFAAFAVSKDADRKDAEGLTNNQWRLAAWILAILAALIAAAIEFLVVVRK